MANKSRTSAKRKTAQPRAKTQTSKRPGLSSELGTLTIHNRALLASIVVEVKQTTYDFGSLAIPISKQGLAQHGLGWLSNLMDLYDMYKFESITLSWVPSASSLTSGSVAMYYDPTPGARPPAVYDAVSGNANVVTTQVARPITFKVPQRVLTPRLPWLLCDSDDLSAKCQGTIVVAQAPGSIPSATGKVMIGSVWIEYTMRLRNPTYLSGAGRAEAPPPVPVMEHLIHQDLLDLNAKMDRQVYAQEQTAEDVSLIASKPGVPPSIGNDLSSISGQLARLDIGAINSAANNGESVNVVNLNKLTSKMADEGNAPVIFNRNGWHVIRNEV